MNLMLQISLQFFQFFPKESPNCSLWALMTGCNRLYCFSRMILARYITFNKSHNMTPETAEIGIMMGLLNLGLVSFKTTDF